MPRPLFGLPLVTPPAEGSPQPVVMWPGWSWWRGENGTVHARCGERAVQAHNFTSLLARIRKAENPG